MDASMRRHFDRAAGDGPGFDPGEMAQSAIAEVGRVRRRRRQWAAIGGSAAGVVAVLGVVAALSLPSGGAGPQTGPGPAAAAMWQPAAAPSCSAQPVAEDATDVAIFLTDRATEGQRAALHTALGADLRISALEYETREQAYERFKALYADSPDFVQAVDRDSIPASFRLRLTDPARFADFRERYAAMPGVAQIVGRVCEPGAPVGGTL
ncbi:hypothetical protein GCM10010168_51030 [Actinoplanes ianthinogenes]|uniref:FtsX extracellular domain-containing protein n=1 Tax=Actinoplanes ianthinogenes TaxID=122358 RepID=A0ABM7M3C7_9ACTN|nr:permease-like cell division protein FtsX [Actinoplanes ianthinogenes]BCJ46154.1 hypothetical protein Aiant_68110 [Actinoplanes ianthinogenes]GGR26641.1 hypothetical protein GCM10010168_51030 [Actinoplanes ianthinogenes]